MNDKYQVMLDEFRMEAPMIADAMVDWWPSGKYKITVRLNDGSVIVYNTMQRAFRNVRENPVDTEEEYRRNLSINLRDRFATIGKSQMDIAKDLGISTRALTNYVTMKSTPSAFVLQKIANYLNCGVEELYQP